jgi:hypothetical protein
MMRRTFWRRPRALGSASLAMAIGFAISAWAVPASGEPRFVSAHVCSACHSRLHDIGLQARPDPRGMGRGMGMMHHDGAPPPVDRASIAPYALWSASMMAHSAIDPYWRAKIRYETAANPAAAAAIENTCLSCHAPMQQYGARAAQEAMRFDDLGAMGLEGVSCTVCHQILPENLGSKDSFTAGFKINSRGEVYGPHRNPFPMPMRMHTGLTPAYAKHMMEAALCGTCHTVITPVLGRDSKVRGEFVEQATYLEWMASSYPRSGKTCQSCHLPVLRDRDGQPAPQYIAHTPHGGYFGPIRPRAPFGRHFLQGANALGLEMLAALHPANAGILEQATERSRTNLGASMTLQLAAKAVAGGIAAEVTVLNHSGHKLPSGFPSRRLWLHVRLWDASGQVVFESGAYDRVSGDIVGSANRVALHRNIIERPEQVAIYEAEMGGPDSGATVSLMRASRLVKDNRLLPLGFDEVRSPVPGMERLSIAPVGVGDDPDFRAGSDTVTYKLDTGRSRGPWTLKVEALYQSIKPSHAAVLDAARSTEERVFLEIFNSRRAPIVAETRVLVVE